MPRIVMKFGGTSMAGIERIRHVAERVKREAEAGNEVLVVVSAMAGETDRLVQLCREAAALYDPKEYDVVVASGEQVTAGLLAMTLQNMGAKARSFMGWQLVRAVGRPRQCPGRGGRIRDARRGAERRHGRGHPRLPGRVSDDGRLATLGRGGSDTSRGRHRRRGQGRPLRHLHRRRRRLHHRPAHRAAGRASSTQVTFEEMLELAGVGAKVLQTRSVGLAMREKLPLRVLSAFEDHARNRDRRRTVRSEHGTQRRSPASPPRRMRRGSP